MIACIIILFLFFFIFIISLYTHNIFSCTIIEERKSDQQQVRPLSIHRLSNSFNNHNTNSYSNSDKISSKSSDYNRLSSNSNSSSDENNPGDKNEIVVKRIAGKKITALFEV